MDLSIPENVKLAEAVVDIDRWMRELLLKWKNTDPIPAIVGNGGWTPLASDPVPAKSFLASADTRGSGGDDMRDAFAEAFHIDENTYCQTEVNQVFDFLNNFDAKTLNFYLKYYVVANLNNFIYKPEHSAENFLSFIAFSSHSILLDYEKEVFLKGSDCEGARSMLEEMRTLFAQRIQNSTWLSEDTKTQALKKLQNMKFLLGAPERIFNADFKLTGKSPVEDLVQYRAFCDEYLRNVLPGLRGADYQWEYVMLSPIGMGLSAGNAFYDPSTNQLCILPAFLGEEMFPKDKNDIFRYVTGWVFAHEMTHGFDGNGAKYDYEGKEADWWKPEDKAKFEKLKQMMVARYNELEQIPGVPANGELTKNENIADLGGMTLAYAVWNNKLKADGLTGEQLRHQQRQFFLEAAHLWQGKPTEEMLLNSLNSDVHSASHNRVNGIVRLMDEWYDLFGVQPDEKLYVKPEDRVKIW